MPFGPTPHEKSDLQDHHGSASLVGPDRVGQGRGKSGAGAAGPMGWKKCAVCDEWRKTGCKTVTPLNLASITAVLRAEGSDLELSSDASPRQVVCGSCYTDDMVSKHAALIEASRHVGNIVRRLNGDRTKQERGKVTALARKPTTRVDALFEVTWETGAVETCTAEQLAEPEAWGSTVEALMHASAAAAAKRTADRIHKSVKRLEDRMAEDPPMDDGAPDDDVFGTDPMRGEDVDLDELNTSQRQTLAQIGPHDEEPQTIVEVSVEMQDTCNRSVDGGTSQGTSSTRQQKHRVPRGPGNASQLLKKARRKMGSACRASTSAAWREMDDEVEDETEHGTPLSSQRGVLTPGTPAGGADVANGEVATGASASAAGDTRPAHTEHLLRQPRSGYRADIDGLRAVAVTAVIVYHMNNSWLPGGFVGVDVFFVISGYVVTSSLLRHQNHSFGTMLSSFYARRVTRLSPALVLMVFATIVAMYNLLDAEIAEELDYYYATAQLALIGASNVMFANQGTSYFAIESNALRTEYNPFTHTWSLGTEEQFYFLFPTIVALAYGQRAIQHLPRWLKWMALSPTTSPTLLLAGSAYVSILFCAGASLTEGWSTMAFYLLPSRFWQMMAGALLYEYGTSREVVASTTLHSPNTFASLTYVSPANTFASLTHTSPMAVNSQLHRLIGSVLCACHSGTTLLLWRTLHTLSHAQWVATASPFRARSPLCWAPWHSSGTDQLINRVACRCSTRLSVRRPWLTSAASPTHSTSGIGRYLCSPNGLSGSMSRCQGSWHYAALCLRRLHHIMARRPGPAPGDQRSCSTSFWVPSWPFSFSRQGSFTFAPAHLHTTQHRPGPPRVRRCLHRLRYFHRRYYRHNFHRRYYHHNFHRLFHHLRRLLLCRLMYRNTRRRRCDPLRDRLRCLHPLRCHHLSAVCAIIQKGQGIYCMSHPIPASRPPIVASIVRMYSQPAQTTAKHPSFGIHHGR